LVVAAWIVEVIVLSSVVVEVTWAI
jgi:hypothetical protein